MQIVKLILMYFFLSFANYILITMQINQFSDTSISKFAHNSHKKHFSN